MLKGQRIVVVMPAYNAARTLEQTYREVIDQGIVDLVLVVDDASADETVEIAKRLDHAKTVVHEHNLGQCYSAVIGQGATRDEQPILARAPEEGFDWLLAVPSSQDSLTVGVVRRWIGTRGFVLRNTGSTVFHLGLVASGVLAGAFAKRCKIWDVAAGALLVQEAGGVITNPTGQELFPYSFDADPSANVPFLAAARAVHSQLLDSIPPVVA